jgi:polysaccharide export outer membrane protein
MVASPLVWLVTALAQQAIPTHPAAVPATSQQTGSPSPAPVSTTLSYTIGPEDQLSITVADESELTGKYRVDTDGSFTFPFLGRVEAAGKTLSELQSALTSSLANGFLRNPQVRVEVDQVRSRSVFVTGEVRNPNEYTMTGGTMTLLQALALAGSPTSNASNEVIVSRQPARPGGALEIVRLNRRDLELGRTGYDMLLRPGDIINVPTAQRFYVDGQVRNPGYYVLEVGMTIQQAVVLAGGLNERGSDRGISVTRTVDGKSVDVPVKLTDKVQANDIVRISSSYF